MVGHEPRGNGLSSWLVFACVECLPLAQQQVRRFVDAHRGHTLRAVHSGLGLWFDVSDLGT